MMFYENFKFKADHVEGMKCLQQFEVQPYHQCTVTMAVTMVIVMIE